MRKSRSTYILLVIAAFLLAFGYFPNAVETIYSTKLYPVISSILRLISGIFPFAIGDFCYALLLILAITAIVKFVLKKEKTKVNYIRFAANCLNVGLCLYIAFKLLWGLNYARPRINTQLAISAKPYQKKELLKLAHFFVGKLQQLSKQSDHKTKYTVASLRIKASEAYKNMAKKNPFFTYHIVSFKPVNSAYLISKTGVEGYYNPLSGEANINHILPAFALPFVSCHEIAHQIGVAKEDEANLVGYLTAVNSTEIAFQYSAYYNMLRYILFEIRMKYPADYNDFLAYIPKVVLADFKTESAFWAQYNGTMSVYMGKTFDKILKLNSQTKGIKSYQDIVLWLYNYHKVDL